MHAMLKNAARLTTLALTVSAAALAQPDSGSDAPLGDGSHSNRPEGSAIGIGIGWAFPQAILEPNTVSVRFRLGRFALEPSVTLAGSSGSTHSNSSLTVGAQPATETKDEDTTGGFNGSIGTAARFTLVSRGTLDLVGIGGLAVGYGSSNQNNDLQDTDALDRANSSTVGASLNYGVGIEWFVLRQLSLSADARNPLLSWSQSTTTVDREEQAAGVKVVSKQTTRQTSLTGGLSWAPSVRVLLHLYF